VTKTTGNSSPFAEWTVINETRSALVRLVIPRREVLRAEQQLAQVLLPRLRFGRPLRLERTQVARALEHARDRIGGRSGEHLVGEPIEERQEATQSAAGTPRVRRGQRSHPLEQGEASLFGDRLGAPERGLADTAGRPVHDAPKRGRVRRIDEQAQIGQCVLDLGAFVEANATDDHVGDVVLEELLLDRTRLRIGSIEHRALPIRVPRITHGIEQAPHHELRLVPVVARCVDDDLIALAAIGDHALGGPIAVVLHDRSGARQDPLRRSVVAFELHHLRSGKVTLEVEDVADVGSAPCVNRLVWVSHHTEVAVPRGQLIDQPVLHAVRVLVLVHEHVLPALLVVTQHFRVPIEELDGEQEQVAEVEGVRLGEQALVGRVDRHGRFALHVLGPLRRRGGQKTRVLPLVDAPAKRARLFLRVAAVSSQRLAGDGEAVGLVVDHEAPRAPEVADLPAQDAHAARMEGREPDVPRFGAEDLHHPLPHLAGSLVGEGDGQDRLGRDAADADQPGDATREHARLAAAGTRQNEQRTLGGLHGLPLLGVEALEKIIGEHEKLREEGAGIGGR
jgi:hypothetical protein